MSQIIDVLKYPSILPVGSQQTEFEGYLLVNGIDYKLHIKLENGKPTLTMNPQLQQFEEAISHLPQCLNIVTFLDDLKSLIRSRTTRQSHKNMSEIYRHILTEYVELREFYINMHKCTISQDLSEIKISRLDECDRVHELVIHADFNETARVFKVAQHGFPEKKDAELFQSHNSLKVIYENFVALIEKLQNFFNVMDSLDCNCWILDPDKPSKKDCYRRIGLDINVSMTITIDPWSNASIPNLQFLGPERLVQGFRQNVAENLINWNSDTDVVQEILKLLGLSHFPARPTETNKEEILLCNTGECCICFSLRLNEKLPDIICENASCEQVFHRECLYQWLVSVNSVQIFNDLCGQCPNCEKSILCPL